MSRTRPAVAVLLTALVGAAAGPAAPAGARAELDRAFFRDGTHVLPALSDRGHAVLVSGGRIFATTDRGGVSAVTMSGRLDTAYGNGGFAGQYVDPGALRGGLLAAPRPGDPRGVIAAAADGAVAMSLTRLTGAGRVDPGWGDATTHRLFYGGGFVYPVGIVGDAAGTGRIFAAAAKLGTNSCGGPVPPSCRNELLVARLDPAGQLDPTWGQAGVLHVPLQLGPAPAAAIGATADGGLTTILGGQSDYLGRAQPTTLVRVSPAGAFTVLAGPAFGYTYGVPIADGASGFWVAGSYTGPGGISHLFPDGTADPALSHVPVPGLSSVSTVHATRDGIVVVGNVRHGITNTPRLLRLTAAGRPDPTFGPRGLLSVRFRHVKISQILDAITEDADGRLVLAGAVGDLYTDIREDYAPTHLALARVRTRPPDLDLLSARVTVDRRGVAAVRVMCTTHVCPGARIDVRRADRTLGTAGLAALLPGRRRAVVVHLGPLGRRLARRRSTVDVRIVPLKEPARPQETDTVLRAARLSASR